jgi:hypothetical protein
MLDKVFRNEYNRGFGLQNAIIVTEIKEKVS